jgi:sugar lactone lactonase YvrE
MTMSKTLLFAASAAALLLAVETKTWVQDQPSDFEKGSMKKLAMRSDGRLRLAPEVAEVFDASQPYLWALVEDSKGNLYTSSGGPGSDKAKIFQVDAKGKSRTVAEVPGSAIHALALNAKDELFAATSPDGKIYKVSANGKVEAYYDPKAKYIWAITFDASGNLFVATGDQGEIHRVTGANQGKVFFKLDEAHARSMVIDRQGNVIVGTEPGGLVLRVTPAGEGFVIYQSTRREITALTLTKNDELYVAGVGSKQGSPAIAPPPPVAMAAPPPPGAMVNQAQPTQRIAVVPPTFAPPNVVVPGGSEVYRLDRDGAPLKIWSHAMDVVYAIALDAQGVPWIGTGNKGGVHRLDTPYLSTLLASLQPTQITAMVSSRQGGIYAVTGNVGKLFRFGPALEKEGSIESEVLDVGTFTQWGRLHSEGAGAVVFETRSGNLERPQKNWSPWAALKEGRVTSPAARFLQWRATLRGDGKQSPELKSIDVAYRAKNLPPRIEDIQATPQNYKPPTASAPIMAITPSLNLPPLGRNRQRTALNPVAIDPGAQPMTVTYSKGSIGARWLAVDDNGDTLEYKLEIKGVSETTWKPLKDKTRDRAHSWDATAYPDGQYVLRVTATDQPDNVPGAGLTASLESEPFTIDNTPPAIVNLTAETASTNLNLRFRVKDSTTMLQAVEYSINGGEWQWAEPTTRLTDSKEHDYQLSIERPAGAEITVAVRASDANDNQAVEKTVVKIDR